MVSLGAAKESCMVGLGLIEELDHVGLLVAIVNGGAESDDSFGLAAL